MKLRMLLLVPMLALSVAGCQTIANVGTVLTLNQPQFLTNERLGQIHAAYDVYLAGARSIRANFPQCAAGVGPSPTNLCYKRDQYLAIQTLTRQLVTLVANIDDWARNNPTIDAGALIDAFNRIISQGTALVGNIQAGRQ